MVYWRFGEGRDSKRQYFTLSIFINDFLSKTKDGRKMRLDSNEDAMTIYMFLSVNQPSMLVWVYVFVCVNTPQGLASPVCTLMSNRLMETVNRVLRDRRPFCSSDGAGRVLLMDHGTDDFHTFHLSVCLCHPPVRPGTEATRLHSRHISLPLY